MVEQKIISLLTACLVLVAVSHQARAQFQNNRQQFNGLNTGFGVQQRVGGGVPGGGQISQPSDRQSGLGQGGGLGQNTNQQPQAGSAEAMRNAFENMSGRERRRATFDFVVESLNEMRESRERRDRRQRAPDPVRVRIRPAFSVAPIDPEILAADLQAGLDQSLRIHEVVANAQVTVDGQIATISGSVTDERERAVLAKMLSLQPGIEAVQNRLVVRKPVSETLSSPAELVLPTPPPPEN